MVVTGVYEHALLALSGSTKWLSLKFGMGIR
jgi:hypothetical protein